ncbi:MAG: T9SS type A sorting domain-containing protein [Calditrichaeota bacterium]|nr:T9SS type A sorting domain-containing protein [Calditrichota bacterium]
MITLLFSFTVLTAETYYLDKEAGNDDNNGTSEGAAWKNVSLIKNKSLDPGDQVLLKRGQSWDDVLNISSDGEDGQPIIFGAYGSGEKPEIYGMDISGDYIIVENLLIDHKKDDSDCVELSRSENLILRNLTIQNGLRDGIDGNRADNILIEGCTIRHFLNGSFSSQADAHGIVLTNTIGMTILNTEIYQVSGDCVQTDPDRDTLPTPDSLWIENCHFWTGPLIEDFNSGWKTGDIPGENALDTKLVKDDWDAIDRMQITIKNTIAHGWKDGNISNMAAFNLKEKIEATLDGVTVYDCEIAFRLRGTRGNANVTIMNTVVYECEKAFRVENDVANLKLYNSTFGANIDEFFKEADSENNRETWEILNNAFLAPKPAEAQHSSNKEALPSDFENSDGNEYQLSEGSSLIDQGIEVALVQTDRDGTLRPQGKGYDIGAYEFEGEPTLISADGFIGPEEISLKQNYPNPFNPETTIEFNIATPGAVTLAIYSSTGQLVRRLINSSFLPGVYSVKWDGKNIFGNKVAGGMYHYRLDSAGKSQTKKMLLIP